MESECFDTHNLVEKDVSPQKAPLTRSRVVLLVDDHELVRYGMRLILEALGCTVIEAGTGEESILLASTHQVDLVFMDIALPGIDGIKTSLRLLEADKNLKVIILTGLQSGALPKTVLQSGVMGYMTKSAAADQMEQAISKVLQGEIYLSPSIASQMALSSFAVEEPIGPVQEGPGELQAESSQLQAETGQVQDDAASPFSKLSQRELQVVMLLMRGYRNEAAGDTLCLNAKTVSTYKRRAYEKLGVENTAEMIKLAMCWGLG